MRIVFALISGLLVVGACAPLTTPHETSPRLAQLFDDEYYDDSWHLSEFWPGEWPDGFVVLEDNVVLAGREIMSPRAPKSISCALPKSANINPWNHSRVETDDLRFMSAQKLSPITMLSDAELISEFSDDAKTLSLESGDILTFKTYYSEGYFLAGFEGENYELNFEQLHGIAEFVDDMPLDEWVQVTCSNPNSQRAWLLLSEVRDAGGVGPVVHDDFGLSSDLTMSE